MITGTWIPTYAERAGQPLPDGELENSKLLLSPAVYKSYMGRLVDFGTLQLDQSTRPKRMEIHVEQGANRRKSFLAIYELVGDNLTICYDLDGICYPDDFATEPGTNLMLVNYNRSA